jgi:peptidyl-prolyl cis-trans isomerase SurA
MIRDLRAKLPCPVFRKLGIFAAVVILSLSNAVYAQSLDRVIAVINDDVITHLELENRLTGLDAEIKTRGGDSPPRDVLRKQMLEQMINDKLQLQAALRMGLSVSENSLDEAVLSVAQNNNLSLRQLREALAAEGIPYALFRESISTQMLINQIYTRLIRNQVMVTDEELDGYVAKGGGKADAREYDVSHILIRVPEGTAPEKMDIARNEAKSIVSRIQRGMDFAEAAATYSDAPDAQQGGRMGWRTPDQLPELFSNALSKIDVGRSTNVLQSPNGFHILYINDAKGDNATAVSQTKVRHILFRTDEFLSQAEAEQRVEQIRERILNGEDFAKLAQVYSNDPISATKGGELGWVMPGELTGSFEDAMSKLDVREMSGPVLSPFGLHLIQVLDRRQQNMGKEVTRGRARAQLVAEKSEERYEDWLRRLRDESYVEILDDGLKL